MTRVPGWLKSFLYALLSYSLQISLIAGALLPILPAQPLRAATLVVNTTADNESDGCGVGACTLREAISDAAPGDTISFSLTYPATVTLSSSLTLSKSLTILGVGASDLAISGGGSDRIFSVTSGVTVTLSGLTLQDGYAAGDGGAIYNAGTLLLEQGYLYDNEATGDGGGIYATGTTWITASTVASNTAGTNGGGIYHGGLPLTLVNSTISANATNIFHGGGLYNASGSVWITATTIAHNTAAQEGGGIRNEAGFDVYLGSVSIGDNTASSGPDLYGNFTSQGYNVYENLSGVLASPNGDLETDPQLGSLGYYGGPTPLYSLLPTSPAIDHVPAAACAVTVDQRGVSRPQPSGGNCDAGAFEMVTVDLAIAKSTGVPSGVVAAGEPLTYTLVFSNAGGGVATGVFIEDPLPAELFVTSVESRGVPITPTGAGTPYLWQVSDLPPLAGGTITVTGVLTPGLSPGHLFTNTATIYSTFDTDVDPANNTASVALATTPTDLVVTKSAEPEPVVAGERLTYTITISNPGSAPAMNVTLSDTLHLSTTLQSVDLIDDDAEGFEEGEFLNTRWYDPRPQVPGANRWLELDDSFLATGVYTSRVIDAGSVGPWTAISWLPRRPYWKDLPDANAAEFGYPQGQVEMFGNRALLHLDAITGTTTVSGTIVLPTGSGIFTDSSGYGLPVTCPATPGESCPTLVQDGRFNRALSFTGGLSETVVISDPVNADSYALEMWVRPQLVTDTAFVLRTDALSGTAYGVSNILGIRNGAFAHVMRDESGATTIVTAPTTIVTGTWYHLVATGRAGGPLRLYVDGEENRSAGVVGTPWTGGDEYRLGSAYPLSPTFGVTGTTSYYTGAMDEVAIYTRTLSSQEVTDHYLRGALRLYFQVRACDDPACAGESFIGPGGLQDAIYSEQMNDSLGLPVLSLTGVPNSRYFQYRAVLATDAPPLSPELRWVRIEPDDRIAISTPQGTCSGDPGTSTFACDLGTLNAGELVTLTFTVNVDPSALGVITNTASVTSTTSESDLSNNTAIVTSTVVGLAEIGVRKDDYRTYVNLGGELRYRVDVINYGPSTAYSLTLVDALPDGLTGYVADANDWICQSPGAVITCTLDRLEPTSDWVRAVEITATAPLTGDLWITNTVEVTSTVTPISATGAITGLDTTFVTLLADLEIDKTVSPDPVDPGAVLTYTVVVTNHGPEPATGLRVTDTLPAGLVGYPVYDPLVWSACSAPGDVVACTLSGTLAVGTGASFAITVTAPLSGFLANYAEVVADEQDPDVNDNDVTIYAAVRPVAGLSIAKADLPDPVFAAAPLTYTLVVTNRGPVAAGQVENRELFFRHAYIGIPAPRETAHRYPSDIRISSFPGVVQEITVTLNRLDHTYPGDLSILLVGPGGQDVMLMENAVGGIPADDVTLVFNQSAGQSLPVSGTLLSGVPYRPTSYDFGYNEDLAPPAPPRPYGNSLAAFQGADPNGTWSLYVYDNVPASDGGRIIQGWELELVTMSGDRVVVSDTLPAGLVVEPPVSTPPGWQCGGGGSGTLSCETDYFDSGDVVTFSFHVTAPITGGVITNTAFVTSTTADLEPADNAALITTTVVPLSDLAVVKSVAPDPVSMGYPLTYVVSVENLGPSRVLTEVTLVDLLPAGLTSVTVEAAPWACDTSALPTFTCTLPGLDLGPAPGITVTANAPMALGLLTNTATITAPLADPDVANNVAFVTVTVGPRPILTLTAHNDSPTLLGDPTALWAVAVPDDGVSYTWAFGDGATGTGTPVTHTYPTTGTFTAVVTATNSVSVLTATTEVTVVLEAADLQLLKLASPLTPTVGQTLTYTLVVTNAGPYSVTTPVTLTDLLPANLSNVGVAAPAPWNCDTSALPTLTCTLPALDLEAAPPIVVRGTVPTVPAVLVNEASVTATLPDSAPENNTAVVTTTVVDEVVAGLAAFNDSPTFLGDPTALTATVTAGTNVTFAWAFGDGATGAGATLTHTYPTTGTFTAIVTATNSAGVMTATTAVTVISPYADLLLEKLPHAGEAILGETFTYTLVITNAGPKPVTDAVTLTDHLPANLSNVGVAAPAPWSCDTSALPALTCTLPGLDLGSASPVVVTGMVTSLSTLTNTARVTATLADPDLASNAVTVTTTVIDVPPAGGQIYLPLVMRNYVAAPDLVVESVVVAGNAVTVTLRNRGTVAVEELEGNEFWVDLYIDPDRPPERVNETWVHVGEQGLVWGVTTAALPIVPGETLTLHASPSGGDYFFPGESSVTWPISAGLSIWAQVDSANESTDYGAVLENHEIWGGTYNNIFGPITSTFASRVMTGAGGRLWPPVWQSDHHLPPRPGSR